MELVVIGLDGLSTNMLDRFDIEPDYISTTIDEGVSGDLMSVDTPTTLPAWTSFATGKDPGTHGLTNMIQQTADYEVGPFETNESEPAIYDLIDDAMLVNLPASVGRLPTAADTHLVSAMLSKDKYDAVPDQLQSLDAFEEYILDHDKGKKSRPDRYFDHVCEITRRRRDFAIEAFDEYDPRFGFVLFSTPDWAGHLLSNFSDEAERATYYNQLLEVVDDCTREVAERAENVVLMSDHGFEKKHMNIHLNDFLEDRGYVVEEDDGRLTPQEATVGMAKAVARRSDRLYEVMRRVYNYIIGTSVGQSLQGAAKPDIDYPNSQAWQLRYGCVFINDDRFDHPQVEDPTALREQLKEDIGGITNSDGEPAFRDVLTAAEAYDDPNQWAPDLVARPAPGGFPTMLDSPTGEYVSKTNNYNHRYRGIFAATGPAFANGGSVEGMSIVDILPTVLAALDEPMRRDFDGDVRTDVLSTEPDVVYLDAAEGTGPAVVGESEASAQQDERNDVVNERLEDLGYLE